MLMRVQIPFPESGAVVTIGETIMQPSVDPATVPIILDIDVVRVGAVEEAQMWTLLNALHEIENRVFEACITDATRSLFQ